MFQKLKKIISTAALFVMFVLCYNTMAAGNSEQKTPHGCRELNEPEAAVEQLLSGLMKQDLKLANEVWQSFVYPEMKIELKHFLGLFDFRVLSSYKIIKHEVPPRFDPKEIAFKSSLPGNYRVYAIVQVDSLDKKVPWLQYLFWVHKFGNVWKVVDFTYIGNQAYPVEEPGDYDE